MKAALVIIALPLLGCGGQGQETRQQPQGAAGAPPSIQAGIHPSYYARSFYSRRLKRRVEQIIPAEELKAVPKNEEERARRSLGEVRAVDEAGEALYRIRQRQVNPPTSSN